jgi:rhamnosyltransferase
MVNLQGQSSMSNTVAVLMATYNGLTWLPEQVESILGQEEVHVRLFVSDDLSTDGTWEWLQEVEAREDRVTLLPQTIKFGGAAKNFFRLVRDVDFSGYDYVSLADQDDIWLPDKLSEAIKRMRCGKFAAYSGNVTAFWPDGRQQIILKSQPQRKYDFLFEAAGPGCTYVLRIHEAKNFKEFLVGNWQAANQVALHDWLIYSWFRANNLQWYIDGSSKMLYRQHASNQIGANHGLLAIINRMKLLHSGWYRREIGKIANLIGSYLPELPIKALSHGEIPRRFLIRHANNVRRRLRDRLFFFCIVMLGIY